MWKSAATLCTTLLLICVAGCGSATPPGETSTASLTPEVPVATTFTPAPGPATPTGRPSPAVPRGNVADPRPVPWESVTPVPGTDQVDVVWWSGVEPCNTLDRVDVEESAGSVEITLYEGTPEDAQNVACIEIAFLKTTRVELEAPLGGREVTDGAK